MSAAVKTPTLYIEGPAFWAPTLPGWDLARAAFTGTGPGGIPSSWLTAREPLPTWAAG